MQTEESINRPGYVPITDGRLYQRPVDTRDAELPRYLGFVGNIVEPESARNRAYLKAGGMEISNPCLRYVKGFVRKCRITPLLEDTHSPVPRETVDPQDKSFYDIPVPAGYVPPWPTQPHMGPSALMHKRALPGEQINQILSGSSNIHQMTPRGVVELRSLKGMSYNPVPVSDGLYIDAEIWRIQKAIFPDFPVVPVSIFKVRELLDAAWEHTYLREVVEDWQVSSQQFEDYARITIEQAHTNMNSVATSVGYAVKYTPVDLVLLEQLGMQRRDREFQQLAHMTGQTQQQGGSNISEIKEMFAMFQQASREERDAIIAAFKKEPAAEPEAELTPVIDPPIDGTTMMASIVNDTPGGAEQIAEATADTQSEFVCGCGKVAGSLAGLKSHQRVCPQLHDTEG
jgi:hypothetical protein